AETKTKSELLIKEADVKAKDLLVGARAEAERELRDRRREIIAVESKLQAREETFEKRLEAFERGETDLKRRDQKPRHRQKAKSTLVEEMVGQARHEAARHIRIVEEEAREEADRRAKRIISIAIERLAGEFVAERTVSVLALPNDEMK